MTLIPLRYRVTERREEIPGTVSLALRPVDQPIRAPLPGQFTMLYVFGVGEIPVSISGSSGVSGIVHTIRTVGPVSRALCETNPGTVLGVRGPFGTSWGLPVPPAQDLVVVAGGIGLAPLRPVIRHAAAHRERYRSVTVLIGARTPGELLYTGEYDTWREHGLDVRVTVDRAGQDWTGNVGVVTTLIPSVDPRVTTAFACGPEAMMRFAARDLVDRGMAPRAIRVSLERNMRCGVGLCGHCQLGPLLVCRDGPVVGYDRAQSLFAVKEL